MSEDTKETIKLIANNPEDLNVISAYSQDSTVAIKDMIFLKKNRIFIMMINRFMWEDIEKGINRQSKRVRCAIKFDGVLEAKSKRINQKNKEKRLECLAIKCHENINKNYEIKIFFSGDSIITLICESIDTTMKDLGLPWNVKYIPEHKF